MGLESLGRTILFIGLIMLIIGGGLSILGKLGLGRLPGDIFIRRGSFTFYFPLVTSIIVSLVLTVILNLFSRR